MKMKLFPILLTVVIVIGCNEAETPDTEFDYSPEEAAESYELAPEQREFWANIQSLCGNAYEGSVGDATPYYSGIADAEQIKIHVRECTDTRTHISLHVDDDHSRNLILTKEMGNLRLKHDHRYEDGTEEEVTQYGGDARGSGLTTRQIFDADEHTATILPDRFDNFWFLDMMNGTTFAYGVHWPKQGNSIRIEFDISETTDEPPAPWGYEE